jgi:hypothetical protein
MPIFGVTSKNLLFTLKKVKKSFLVAYYCQFSLKNTKFTAKTVICNLN